MFFLKLYRVVTTFLAAFFLIAALVSCSFKEEPALLMMAPLPDDGNICKIAVLPFANNTFNSVTKTLYPQAESIFGRVFSSELINTGNFLLVQEGDVRKALKQMRILPGQMPSIEQLRAIADRLGVQVVVAGSVVEMQDKDKRGHKLDPSLAVIIRIIEADTGRTLWTTYSRREGKQYRKIMHFGLVNTVTTLSAKVAKEIIEAWYEGGLKKCIE